MRTPSLSRNVRVALAPWGMLLGSHGDPSALMHSPGAATPATWRMKGSRDLANFLRPSSAFFLVSAEAEW